MRNRINYLKPVVGSIKKSSESFLLINSSVFVFLLPFFMCIARAKGRETAVMTVTFAAALLTKVGLRYNMDTMFMFITFKNPFINQ
ncbi:hypothetical protein Y032_0731g1901 [Ancylostoma ceylanicum]|uniref:Uncharacterized protein n=1 Tax=Ancylostoma ceylanicum TaxID=53326 RepID=A0A016WGU9_9BILA|nr:hypothetical protein Y032_0731g1901 [Ancylostoma ceylanicum]